MSKKFVYWILVILMVLGLYTPVLAVEDTGQSTKVSLSGVGLDSYLLTVPASMAPGSSDTVTLSGTWPSNKTYTTTVDNTVVLKNDIDTSESVSANVSIETLSLAGNNKTSVSATANVSVGQIPDVLFGNWVGNFKYYITADTSSPSTQSLPTMAKNSTWYKSTQEQNSITSIKFDNSYIPTGNEDETWYADVDNGTVSETAITAYRTGVEIVIASNSGKEIMANVSSRYMFSGFGKLTELDISGLNTSNTENMYAMFSNCSSLTSLDLSSFNTSKVEDMSWMFSRCTSLTALDLSSFDTSKVQMVGSMFSNCSGLISIDVSGFDMSSCYYFAAMFSECKNLVSVDMFTYNYDTSISDHTDFKEMFFGCLNLESVDLSRIHASNIVNMGQMLRECSKLTSVDLSGFETSKCEYLMGLFLGCSGLNTIYVGNGWSVEGLPDDSDSHENMFYGCTNLPNFNSSVIDKTNAHTGEGGYLTLKV